jgi:hypothetical protein
MTIGFYDRTNQKTSGDDEVNIGQGSLIAANVALRGFHMTYGENSERDISSMHARLLNTWTKTGESGEIVFGYYYECEMRDKEGRAASLNMRSLVISEIDS